jgi:hypothetical protein
MSGNRTYSLGAKQLYNSTEHARTKQESENLQTNTDTESIISPTLKAARSSVGSQATKKFLLMAQRDDRVEACGPPCRIEAKKDAHSYGE